MNGMEDALHDYLSQFDEPTPAQSVRYMAYLEQKLEQAGQLPAEGKIPMTIPSTPPPPDKPIPHRVRIYEHVTQSRFLHIEDALGIGKLRFFAGTYERHKGAKSLTAHFVSLADVRVIFAALANAEPNFNYKEYKGTPPQAGKTAVSRVLSVTTKGENVYIELKTGPGKLTDTGAITPNGQPTAEVNVALKVYEARRMARSVLAYLHAWDVMQMMVHQHLVSKPMPYLLVATAAEGGTPNPERGQSSTANTPQRPITRKGQPINGRFAATANGKNGKTAVSPPPSASPPAKPNGQPPAETSPQPPTSPFAPLTYGDGTVITDLTSPEAKTFRQFVTEKKQHPASKTALRHYYSQHPPLPRQHQEEPHEPHPVFTPYP